MLWISLIALLMVLVPVVYLMVLAMAAARVRPAPTAGMRAPCTRFMIAIPAHNEANVIGASVAQWLSIDYPSHLYTIHVVADHCSDRTADLARSAGAIVHERDDGPRTGKGAAISWLLEHVHDDASEAVVIFDADTRLDPQFLRVMEARLMTGAQAVQGQHVISNPRAGWFPALAWAMFLVDNRFQNLGRTNLGWSAKNMGDSICFRADILRRIGWGEGLTEDYQLRQRLLLDGVKIEYEPHAKGYGEAPLTWHGARAQRARWLRGTRLASRQFAGRLFAEALTRRDLALLDGALQAQLPSFSTVTLVTGVIWLAHVLICGLVGPVFPPYLLVAWSGVLGLLFLYPLFGLALERAPGLAFLVILTGPIFMVWRTALAIRARLDRRPEVWVRTLHRGKGETS
jgi:cellulose synthase/poly-beta-1,6-N-acetylglucosamine synthase-like glycosyltransferase